MSKSFIRFIGELTVGAPKIPVPSDIDLEKLKPEEQPITLQIGRVGAMSRSPGPNGEPRLYGQKFYEALVSQINEKRPEGAWGHLLDAQKRSEHYEEPALRWIGAMIDDEGVVWGKCIPQREDAQRHLRIAEAANAQVATSLLGIVIFEGNEGVDIELENLDLAHPPRAGVEDAISYVVVGEMAEGDDETMSTVDQLTAELSQQTTRVSELEARVGELEGLEAQHTQLRTLISENATTFARAEINLAANGDDLAMVLGELIQKLQAAQVSTFVQAAESTVSELVTLEALRPIVLRELNLVDDSNASSQLVAEMYTRLPDEAAIKARVAEIMEMPFVKIIAQALVSEQAGPSAIVGKSEEKDWREKMVENAGKIAREMGIN